MKRILITEGNAANRALYENAFSSLDEVFNVSFVSSADECLNYLNGSDHYDLFFILLDLNVEGAKEADLLTTLSSKQAFRILPVIVFSEVTNAAEIIDCYNKGANACVKKPSSQEEYNKVISSIADFWGTVNVLVKPEAIVDF